MAEEGSSSPFNATIDELVDIVNFDLREDDEHIQKFKDLGVDGLSAKVHSDVKHGLDPDEAKITERRDYYGRNRVPPPPAKNLFRLIIDQFQDVTLIILLVGATVTLGLGIGLHWEDPEWAEGTAIFTAVFIVVMVTAVNDYLKDKKFQKAMAQEKDRVVKVRRGGDDLQISSYDVVVGDIVYLAVGDEIPADGVFVAGQRLVVDESSLTGETDGVKKSADRPFLFSGCAVSEGSQVEMMVTTVGASSAGGKIQMLLASTEQDPTPLQEKLEVMALKVGYLGMIAGTITFVGMSIRYAIISSQDPNWSEESLILLLDYFVLGVTVVVVAVPEGLPLAVTIALAFSMVKMMKDKNFVRHLSASETMGGATCICSDKTGTLTQNRMTVTSTSMSGLDLCDGGAGSYPMELQDLLKDAIALNSTCYITYDQISGLPRFAGSKTEGALLMLAKDHLGCDYKQQREVRHPDLVVQWEFTSKRKAMSTVVKTNGKLMLHVKGASEVVLGKCPSQYNAAGAIVPITDEERKQLEDTIDGYTDQGLRTLTLACKQIDREPQGEDDPEEYEADLVLLGVVGIKDPVRPEVPHSVDLCKTAGIVVRMVTGDNIRTARFIARECGIYDESEGHVAMEGPVFRALSVEERDAAIPKLRVLARSSPEDKLILVKRLKQMGEVVAVTGDGTNDAPAIKEAHVGFAMNLAGTDAAKNASDIILLDDNFTSIVNAVKWGRNVFDSIRKFLQFQLSVNLVAMAVVFIGGVVEGSSPLNPVQLLWVNLIMDTLGALALATDNPTELILKRPPHRKGENPITSHMKIYIAWQFVFQTVVLVAMLFGFWRLFCDIPLVDPTLDCAALKIECNSGLACEAKKNTLVFTTFVIFQVMNETLARHLDDRINIFDGINKNPYFMVIMVTILVIQIILIQVGGSFVETVPLHILDWVGCFVCGLIMLPVGVLMRVLVGSLCPVAEVTVSEEDDDDENKDGSEDNDDNAMLEGGKPGDDTASNQPLVETKPSSSSVTMVTTPKPAGDSPPPAYEASAPQQKQSFAATDEGSTDEGGISAPPPLIAEEKNSNNDKDKAPGAGAAANDAPAPPPPVPGKPVVDAGAPPEQLRQDSLGVDDGAALDANKPTTPMSINAPELEIDESKNN